MSDFYEKLEKAKKKVNSGTVSKPAAPARPSGSSYDRFQSMMSKAKQTVSERSRAVAPAPRPVRSPIEMLRDQANINQMAFPGIDAKKAATDIVNGKMPMRKPTLKDLTIGSAKRGYVQSDYGKAVYDEMNGRKNDADDLETKLNSEEFAFEPRTVLGKGVSGWMETVGQQINQMTNPESVAAGTGAALAASIAGKAGPQVLLPEEFATVPAAFMKGMSVGSAKQNYEIEAGLAYKEMLDVGVTPETAKGIAMAVGAGNAALEAMQLDELVKSARIMKRSGADKVADGFFKNLMKEIGRRAPGVANEVAQEVAQEGVTIAGTQIGSKKDVGKFAYTSEDIAGRLGDTAISSLLTFGTMAAPGTAMSAYTNNQQQKRSAAIEQLRQSAEKMKADTEESSTVAENATTTPTDREDRTVAKKETVQNESLRKGIEQVEQDGTVHSKAADAIASDKDAIQILREKAGLDLDSKTASSEKRRAIKDAVAALASSESEETVEESSYTTKEKTAPTQPYTREQYEADRAIVDEAQARVESAEASGAPQENIDALRSDLREKQGNVRAISDPGLKQYKSAYGENGQKAMTGMYQKGQNVGEYLGAFSRYYQAGVSGQKMNSVKGEYAFSITPAQRQAAYFAGKNDAKLSLQRETAARGQQKVSDGGIDFNDPYVRQSMSPGAAVQLDRIARALGLKVRFVDMVRPRMKDGKLQGTANAQIQGSEVLVEKGNPNSIRFLLGHEWTHRMQALSPKEYRAFRKVVSKEMAAEVQAKLDLYRSKGAELDYESALDEVAADYAGRLIEDGAFLDEFIRKNLEHRSMLEKVADAIHELVGKLTGKEKGQAAAAEAKLRKALKASVKQVEKNRKQDSIREKIERSEPVSGVDEVKYSLSLDPEYMEKAEKYNKGKKNPFVSAKNMMAAREARKAVADIFNLEKKRISEGLEDTLGLPEDIIANTYIPNGSYSGTEENTTVCIRSMAADALMDAVAEYLGRPLTVEDTLAVSQEYWQYTDKGECRYCYVAMDRKAYREFLGSYLEQRDDAIQNLRNGMSEAEAYKKFLDGRKDTKNMKRRFGIWAKLAKTGGEMITPADLASTAAMEKAIARNPALKEQINDARKYAQSASWAKKRINYAAYNNHILRWKDDRIRKLNSNYGLRMYSFSDFSPAFILENMQMITDAAVRGLKVLAYTKEIDFVKIFAPTGMNINISVFGYGNKSMGVTQDGNGMVSMDAMQGADWAEAQAMRAKYPNVGVTFVATNDDQIEWALAQDWIDVVIPFHLVRTGSKVASYFGWKNYTAMSADLKNKDWKKGDPKSILPPEHQNDKTKYLEACRKNHLTPRFAEWIDNPNYMKLVNETRRSEGDTPTVQPIFDVDAAKASIETMRKQGGYYKPIGGDLENMRDIAADIGDMINEGKTQYSLKEDSAIYSMKGTSEDSQMADLKKENAALQRRLEYWMEQSKVNKFPKPDKAALKKAAASLLKTYTSKADADSIIAKMAELYDGIIRDPEGNRKETYEQAWELADTIAQEIVDSALEADDEMHNDYAELRKIIRDKKIVLPESAKADIPDWSEWKSTVGKRLHVVVGKDGNIDSFYKDLAKEYPNFFDEERESAASDQLLRIAEIVNELHNINEYNPFEKDDTTYKRAVMDAANEVMETVFDLPKAKPTRAEKAAKQADDQLLAEQMYQGRKLAKVQRGKMSADQRIAALRQKVKDERKTAEWMAAETKLAEEVYYGAKIAELRRKNRERSAELLKREADRRTTQVEKLKERYREKDARKRESRNAKELRAKIIRHVGKMSTKLLRPTDNQHIPDSLRTAALELMKAINLESGYETITLEDGTTKRVPAGTDPKAEATKRTEKFRELNAIYTKLLEDQPDMAAVMDPDLMANLAELTSAESGLAGKPIANMSLEQLTTVWQTIRAVEASIAGANKAFAAGRYETVAEWADALDRANMMKDQRGEYNNRTLGKIVDLATIKMMTPQQFLHQLGMDDLFHMLRRAQDKKIRILDEAQEEVHKIIGKTKIRKLEQEVNTFRLGSGDIELSTAQIMSLYELMKREPAKQHILEGGIWPELIPGQKGLKSHRSNERIRVTEFDLNTMFDSLTDEEKRIADSLQRLLAGRMAAYGNEASNTIYNYSKFGEENYFPMKVDSRTVASKPMDVNGGVKTIAGTGSAKALKPKAQNGLIIDSIFDSVSNNINEMSTYAAWLPAITDLTRIINFVYKDDQGAVAGYAKDVITKAMGKGGLDYIRKLADDINAGVSGEPAITSGMIGKFKAAAIGGNIRVFLQQPSAIFRAFSMISPKYMAMAKPKRGTWEKVKKYVPIAVWKDWGYFDVRTGRGIKDIVFDVSGQTRYRDIFRNPKDVVEKINQAAMQPAGTMDSLAWSYLWSICEAEVADTHKAMDRNSEAFNQLVAQRFTDIIDQTQVVDGIMQRSDAMRSENALDKMATAFMAEPTKTYNMLLGAISDLRNGDDKKAARHALGRTMGAVVVSFAVNAIAQSAVDALRDDDDDDYDKKFWDAYLENFSENFNPFSYVPYMKDIVSMLQGYDVKRTDMEVFSRIIASGRNLTKALNGESKQSVPGAFANFLLESSRMFGMPLANIKRDVQAALRTIFRANGNYLAQYYGGKLIYSVTQNTSMFNDILYDAYKHDKIAYRAIYEDMRKSGVSDKKIQNAIERGMKADQGVTKAEDLKSRYMTPEQQAVYDTYSRKVRSSSAWREADADERKSAERKLFQMATRDPENDNRKKKLTHNQEALEILRQLAN